MKFNTTLVCFVLASFSTASFFSDILRGVANSGKYKNFFRDLPSDFLQGIEEDENKAGEFVCDILGGRPTDALGDVVNDLGEEAIEDFDAITKAIVNLPSLAPLILSAIEDSGESAISIVEQLVTDPGGAFTVIVDDVVSTVENAWGDITDAVVGIVTGLVCEFGDCPAASTASGVNGPAALSLTNACNELSTQPTSTAFRTLTVATFTTSTISVVSNPSPATITSFVSTSTTGYAGQAANSTLSNFAPPSPTTQSSEGTKRGSDMTWVCAAMLGLVMSCMLLL